MPDLPPWLGTAVERHLDRRSRADLAERSGRISRAYRAGQTSQGVVRSAEDALAYAVARMPATYAAAWRVLSEIRDIAPDFEPHSVLDAGSGPGTAGFAALALWPALRHLTQIDHNAAFLELSRELAEPSGVAPSQQRAELARLPDDLGARDLVILGYVLAEFGETGAADLAERLWNKTERMLVVVEPGTPDGYARVVAARRRLIASGAHILAPCPHGEACPLAAPDWCHFSQRLPRRRAHMAAKGASLPFEDERFSYLVAVRAKPFPTAGRHARIIAPPQASKAAIRFKLCTPDGTCLAQDVAKRDRPAFAEARRLDWGDRFAAFPGAADEDGSVTL